MTAPIEWPGTTEEMLSNHATHLWRGQAYGPDDDDVEWRCDKCDCRPGSTSGMYPCGLPVPMTDWPEKMPEWSIEQWYVAWKEANFER